MRNAPNPLPPKHCCVALHTPTAPAHTCRRTRATILNTCPTHTIKLQNVTCGCMKQQRAHFLRVGVIRVVRIAIAQARASPGFDSQKVQHADVGGVRAEIPVQAVNVAQSAWTTLESLTVRGGWEMCLDAFGS